MLISKNFGLGARYPLPVWLARAELIFVLIDNGCTPWRDLEAKRTTLSIFFAFPSPLTPNNFRTVGSCKKHFFPLGSIFPAARSEPGMVGCEARMLPICYADPQNALPYPCGQTWKSPKWAPTFFTNLVSDCST